MKEQKKHLLISWVWIINHCLGLGHETMVCAVCLTMFLWDILHVHYAEISILGTHVRNTNNYAVAWFFRRKSTYISHKISYGWSIWVIFFFFCKLSKWIQCRSHRKSRYLEHPFDEGPGANYSGRYLQVYLFWVHLLNSSIILVTPMVPQTDSMWHMHHTSNFRATHITILRVT